MRSAGRRAGSLVNGWIYGSERPRKDSTTDDDVGITEIDIAEGKIPERQTKSFSGGFDTLSRQSDDDEDDEDYKVHRHTELFSNLVDMPKLEYAETAHEPLSFGSVLKDVPAKTKLAVDLPSPPSTPRIGPQHNEHPPPVSPVIGPLTPSKPEKPSDRPSYRLKLEEVPSELFEQIAKFLPNSALIASKAASKSLQPSVTSLQISNFLELTPPGARWAAALKLQAPSEELFMAILRDEGMVKIPKERPRAQNVVPYKEYMETASLRAQVVTYAARKGWVGFLMAIVNHDPQHTESLLMTANHGSKGEWSSSSDKLKGKNEDLVKSYTLDPFKEEVTARSPSPDLIMQDAVEIDFTPRPLDSAYIREEVARYGPPDAVRELIRPEKIGAEELEVYFRFALLSGNEAVTAYLLPIVQRELPVEQVNDILREALLQVFKDPTSYSRKSFKVLSQIDGFPWGLDLRDDNVDWDNLPRKHVRLLQAMHEFGCLPDQAAECIRKQKQSRYSSLRRALNPTV